jgi:hypothetical protein
MKKKVGREMILILRQYKPPLIGMIRTTTIISKMKHWITIQAKLLMKKTMDSSILLIIMMLFMMLQIIMMKAIKETWSVQ